jgi:hypothetical protein
MISRMYSLVCKYSPVFPYTRLPLKSCESNGAEPKIDELCMFFLLTLKGISKGGEVSLNVLLVVVPLAAGKF